MHKMLFKHPSIIDADALKKICAPLALFNITTFSHVRVNDKYEFSVMGNHPEFMAHYLDKGYHNADISSKDKLGDISHYLMWDMLDCRGKTAAMLNDAALFDYRHIFTLVKQSSHHTDYYHFGTDQTSYSINQWYVNNLDKLELFINYFEEKMAQSKLLSKGYQITFPIVESEHCQILDANSIPSNDQTFLNQISRPTHLSFRQRQCVALLLQGHSTKQIAKELNISARTVEDYLNALKQKLNAKNKTHLIFKLIHDKKISSF